MGIENAEAKLQEAQATLDKMRDAEQTAISQETFSHSLSAFLAAAMSVRDAFHVPQDRERNQSIKKWKENWEAQLTPRADAHLRLHA